jgi:hypothetical protein
MDDDEEEEDWEGERVRRHALLPARVLLASSLCDSGPVL